MPKYTVDYLKSNKVAIKVNSTKKVEEVAIEYTLKNLI